MKEILFILTLTGLLKESNHRLDLKVEQELTHNPRLNPENSLVDLADKKIRPPFNVFFVDRISADRPFRFSVKPIL